jgi:hypothetical protein
MRDFGWGVLFLGGGDGIRQLNVHGIGLVMCGVVDYSSETGFKIREVG